MTTAAPSGAKILVNAIVHGLQEVKGRDITILDLRDISHAISSYFIVANGTSRTQVTALAEGVEHATKEILKEGAWRKEGLRNGEWAILDYGDVVVHVFHEEARSMYDLEGLWGDAKMESIKEVAS